MTPDDLPALLRLQERGAVTGLAEVFPQDTHPFPAEAVAERWRGELGDPEIAAYVATDADTDLLVAFAARRHDEILHFGTAVETWGSGLAGWTHDQLLAGFPEDVQRLRLWVFEGNGRGRRFYEKLGWRPTGARSTSALAPHPVLLEYALARSRAVGHAGRHGHPHHR